jgi:hypothetical protein
MNHNDTQLHQGADHHSFGDFCTWGGDKEQKERLFTNIKSFPSPWYFVNSNKHALVTMILRFLYICLLCSFGSGRHGKSRLTEAALAALSKTGRCIVIDLEHNILTG